MIGDSAWCHVLSRILLRSRSRLARPNIWRLRALTRQTLPSTAPLLWARAGPLMTAAWSRRMPRVKECRQGQVVEAGSGDPHGQALAVAAGHHLGERGDVAGGGAQARAAGFDLAELGCRLLVGEVAGVAGYPPVTSRTAGSGGGITEAVSVARSGCR